MAEIIGYSPKKMSIMAFNLIPVYTAASGYHLQIQDTYDPAYLISSLPYSNQASEADPDRRSVKIWMDAVHRMTGSRLIVKSDEVENYRYLRR
ncbi:MAG: hypothetical protein QMD46_08575 [Methanomicrobiales archaeon]|nr:hypothetical protein [Methanomicrobiales archaeon]